MIRRALLMATCGLAIAIAGTPSTGARAAGPSGFTTPVKLTQFAQCGGYEPTVLVDKFGNIVVTAHKQNHCDGVAFDPNTTPPARAASWVWTSTDGVTFTDMPGIPAGTPSAGASSLDVGDEGDLAQDNSGNIYFVDTKVADNSFTSWHATGLGQLTETFHTAAIGTAQPVDDRPWITAHGGDGTANGTVLYAGNTGNASVYSSPNGNGAGRFTTYMSYTGSDTVTTFDNLGITIPSSGWCRPAADHRAGSHLLYVVCTDDGSNLFAYVSADDGHTAAGWHKYPIGTSANGALNPWVMAAVGPDGTVYVLDVNSASDGSSFHTNLFRSTDSGQTWTEWDATPQNGRIATNAGPAWLDVAPDGRLGMDYFVNPPGDPNWHIEAATTPAWLTPFTPVDVSPNRAPATTAFGTPWGDFLSCAFGPDSRLHVSWTDAALDTTLGQQGLNSDIYYAEETTAPTGIPETPATAAIVLAGLAGATAIGIRRHRLSFRPRAT